MNLFNKMRAIIRTKHSTWRNKMINRKCEAHLLARSNQSSNERHSTLLSLLQQRKPTLHRETAWAALSAHDPNTREVTVKVASIKDNTVQVPLVLALYQPEVAGTKQAVVYRSVRKRHQKEASGQLETTTHEASQA